MSKHLYCCYYSPDQHNQTEMAINAAERLAVQLPPHLVYKKHLTLTVPYEPYTEVQLVRI